MNYYIGIDPSLAHTGFIILNEEDTIIRQLTIPTSSKDIIEDRINTITNILVVESILPLCTDSTICKIGIEGLSFGSRGQSMLELSGLHYHLRLSLWNKGIDYSIIPPTQLKKFVSGKGNSKKDLMLLNVYKKWGVEFNDDNLADAYGLAQMMKTI